MCVLESALCLGTLEVRFRKMAAHSRKSSMKRVAAEDDTPYPVRNQFQYLGRKNNRYLIIHNLKQSFFYLGQFDESFVYVIVNS